MATPPKRARNPENAPPPPYCSSRLAALLTAQAYKEGVLISAGTDSFAPADDLYPALQSEIEILVHKVGMPPMDALRSAMLISAMSMGQQPRWVRWNLASLRTSSSSQLTRSRTSVPSGRLPSP